MGCGSSQSGKASAAQRNTKATVYSHDSEPSTTCSSLDHRTDPDGQEYDDITPNNGTDLQQPRPRHKPQAEYWAPPPPPSSRQPGTQQGGTGWGPAGTGPQPTQHAGHSFQDRRTRPAQRGRSDRQPCLDPETP